MIRKRQKREIGRDDEDNEEGLLQIQRTEKKRTRKTNDKNKEDM